MAKVICGEGIISVPNRSVIELLMTNNSWSEERAENYFYGKDHFSIESVKVSPGVGFKYFGADKAVTKVVTKAEPLVYVGPIIVVREE